MLTKKDLTQIETIVEEKLEEKLDQKFDERLKFLPTKDDFYTQTDALMGEIKTVREELEIINGRTANTRETLENHEERIVTLESKADK